MGLVWVNRLHVGPSAQRRQVLEGLLALCRLLQAAAILREVGHPVCVSTCSHLSASCELVDEV